MIDEYVREAPVLSAIEEEWESTARYTYTNLHVTYLCRQRKCKTFSCFNAEFSGGLEYKYIE